MADGMYRAGGGAGGVAGGMDRGVGRTDRGDGRTDRGVGRQGATAGGSSVAPPAPLPVVPPRQTERPERRMLGKPLRWSRGWAVVVAVWLVLGVVLFVARLDMGHLTAWSPHEAAAVARVRAYMPDGVHRTDELLAVVAQELSPGGRDADVPYWYAFERPWEGRVYVIWECSQDAGLSFTVRGAEVRPDGETRDLLLAVARSLASR